MRHFGPSVSDLGSIFSVQVQKDSGYTAQFVFSVFNLELIFVLRHHRHRQSQEPQQILENHIFARILGELKWTQKLAPELLVAARM